MAAHRRNIALAIAVLATATAAAAFGAERVHIVALGASNTAGYGVSAGEDYPAQLEVLLRARGVEATVANAGLSGDTTAGMLARLDSETLPDTRLVILQPGSNDARYGSGAERAANIAAIGSRLATRGIALIVIENDMLGALPDSEMQADGIHYTARGYGLLAERILPAVLAALGR
jgi:acyl-CoA thioesterase I